MKKIINFGSINIDHVYQVDHQVAPGETLAAAGYQIFPGGKGLNQSIALAKAGAEVLHVGKIGQEGAWLKEYLSERGVDTRYVNVSKEATGHAILQVSPDGENAIIIHGGANRDLDSALIESVFQEAQKGDYLLLQNETNHVMEIIEAGREKGLTLMFNPAPMDAKVKDYPLALIDWLVVNETEGQFLTGKKANEEIIAALRQRYPATRIVLTMGRQGLSFADSRQQFTLPAFQVKAIDTTATGDTFIGFLLAAIVREEPLEMALREASAAAALCATRQGAASSIGNRKEVQEFLKSHRV